jgi:hypothetical protein
LKKTISCQAERDLCAGHFSLIIFFRNTGGRESLVAGASEEGFGQKSLLN